jgi:putative addiction module component (TIGR02574 family)
MTVARIKQQAMALAPRQRLRLVQDIWDSLVEEPAEVRVPDHHRQLIDQRLARHERDPGGTIRLSEAKARVRRKLAGNRKR